LFIAGCVVEKCYQCAYSPPKTVYEKVKKGYGYVSFYTTDVQL